MARKPREQWSPAYRARIESYERRHPTANLDSPEGREAARGHRGPAGFERGLRTADGVTVYRDGRVRARVIDQRGAVRWYTLRTKDQAETMTDTERGAQVDRWVDQTERVPDVTVQFVESP